MHCIINITALLSISSTFCVRGINSFVSIPRRCLPCKPHYAWSVLVLGEQTQGRDYPECKISARLVGELVGKQLLIYFSGKHPKQSRLSGFGSGFGLSGGLSSRKYLASSPATAVVVSVCYMVLNRQESMTFSC